MSEEETQIEKPPSEITISENEPIYPEDDTATFADNVSVGSSFSDDSLPELRRSKARPKKSAYTFDDSDEVSFSWKQSPPKPKQKTRIPQSSSPPTFLTQIGDSKVKNYENESTKVVPPPKKRAVIKRKMTPAMMMFKGVTPSIPTTQQVDLSKYDNEEGFDPEVFSSTVPPLLLEMIVEPPSHIVYRAVCGWPMTGYPKRVVSRVLLILKKYLDQCVEKMLITESAYLQNIIEDIKSEKSDPTIKSAQNLDRVNERLANAQATLEFKQHKFKQESDMLNVELDLAIEDLRLRYEEEADALDAKWNSEQMQSRFNKPSPKLIELRQDAKLHLQAHKFDEATQLAENIAELEEQETKEAAYRMNLAYQQAHNSLKVRMEQEKKVLEESFKVKQSKLEKMQFNALTPLQKRIDNLTEEKKATIDLLKRQSRAASRPQTQMTHKAPLPTHHGPINLDGKLKLPPLPMRSK